MKSPCFCMTLKMIILSLLLLCIMPAAMGFVTPQKACTTQSTSTTGLPSTSSKQEEQGQNYHNNIMELEALMAGGGGSAENKNNDENKLLLTSHVERIKELEVNLLQCLEESDEAIDAIVDLWMKEREDASLQLQHMERHCSPGLAQEEAQLHDMIDEYGLEWVEPMIRLSLLLFTKGRYGEATMWCREALLAKPWHFEAGQLLVALYLRQEDFTSALAAARQFALPNLSATNKRRKAWVQRNVQAAQTWLDQARQITQKAVHDDVLDECAVDDDFCWG